MAASPKTDKPPPASDNIQHAFFAGAIAGTVTDTVLHPLDTVKTRMQSPQGFKQAGGFRNVFAGVAPGIAGSAPSAAVFFGAYNVGNRLLGTEDANGPSLLVKSAVASVGGEVSACIVRAAVDIVKNNMQVGRSWSESVKELTSQRKFNKVYLSLLSRDVPFGAIQLPILEWTRNALLDGYWGSRVLDLFLTSSYSAFLERQKNEKERQLQQQLSAESSQQQHAEMVKQRRVFEEERRVKATSIAGFVAGGLAAFVTTPIDHVKTKIALYGTKQFEEDAHLDRKYKVGHQMRDGGREVKMSSSHWYSMMIDIVHKDGVAALFKGVAPRVVMISCGGTIFFGSYEYARIFLVERF